MRNAADAETLSVCQAAAPPPGFLLLITKPCPCVTKHEDDAHVTPPNPLSGKAPFSCTSCHDPAVVGALETTRLFPKSAPTQRLTLGQAIELIRFAGFIPSLPRPGDVSTVSTLHDDAPPPGEDETAARPPFAVATHSPPLAHEIAVKNGEPWTAVLDQAAGPSPGLLEDQTSPSTSTATQREADAHEMPVTTLGHALYVQVADGLLGSSDESRPLLPCVPIQKDLVGHDISLTEPLAPLTLIAFQLPGPYPDVLV